jgi:hypothetical protein
VPISPPCSSRWTTSLMGCSLRRFFWATPYTHLGRGMGWLPMSTGSGSSASFLKKNYTFHHSIGGLDIERLK